MENIFTKSNIHPIAKNTKKTGFAMMMVIAVNIKQDVVLDPFCDCATTLVAADYLIGKILFIAKTYHNELIWN